MQQPGFLREMKRDEEGAVDALLRAAFGGEDEVRLVAKLRKSGAMVGENVLPTASGPVGYFALSAMRSPKGWLCLAPVAVHPDWQGKGYGRRILGMLAGWAGASRQYIVVLGDPGFYRRCGFSSERAARLKTPYPVDHTLLIGPGTDAPEVDLLYPQAFG